MFITTNTKQSHAGKDVTLGFIMYSTEAGARRAVSELQNYELEGSKLHIVYEKDSGGGVDSGGGANGMSNGGKCVFVRV